MNGKILCIENVRGIIENINNPLGYEKREELFDSTFAPENIKNLMKSLPILKKEYNPDGTRKNAIQLLEDSKIEYQRLQKMHKEGGITKEEYRELVDDCGQMYVELIYKSVERMVESCSLNQKRTYRSGVLKMLLELKEKDNTLFRTMVKKFEKK